MTQHLASILLATYLAFFHHVSPPSVRACIDRNADAIAARLTLGERIEGVPAGVMLVVAFRESHIGCDAGEGGNWGAPASRTRRHDPGTPMQAVAALGWSYDVCGDWLGAVARFHSGLCRPWQPRHRAYVAAVRAHVLRLYAAVGSPPPEGF